MIIKNNVVTNKCFFLTHQKYLFLEKLKTLPINIRILKRNSPEKGDKKFF